jgi:hypothetical protein
MRGQKADAHLTNDISQRKKGTDESYERIFNFFKKIFSDE